MTPASTAEEQLWKVDARAMEAALKPYPKLLSAVFPPIDVDGVSPQDITVYQLLQVQTLAFCYVTAAVFWGAKLKCPYQKKMAKFHGAQAWNALIPGDLKTRLPSES